MKRAIANRDRELPATREEQASALRLRKTTGSPRSALSRRQRQPAPRALRLKLKRHALSFTSADEDR
jgi:hypothetical protein